MVVSIFSPLIAVEVFFADLWKEIDLILVRLLEVYKYNKQLYNFANKQNILNLLISNFVLLNWSDLYRGLILVFKDFISKSDPMPALISKILSATTFRCKRNWFDPWLKLREVYIKTTLLKSLKHSPRFVWFPHKLNAKFTQFLMLFYSAM